MANGPFIDDPRDGVRQQIELAIASPIGEVRAIHIRAAEHLAGIARDSRLVFNLSASVQAKRDAI